jgi:hypothetical protein
MTIQSAATSVAPSLVSGTVVAVAFNPIDRALYLCVPSRMAQPIFFASHADAYRLSSPTPPSPLCRRSVKEKRPLFIWENFRCISKVFCYHPTQLAAGLRFKVLQVLRGSGGDSPRIRFLGHPRHSGACRIISSGSYFCIRDFADRYTALGRGGLANVFPIFFS